MLFVYISVFIARAFIQFIEKANTNYLEISWPYGDEISRFNGSGKGRRPFTFCQSADKRANVAVKGQIGKIIRFIMRSC